MPKPKHIPEVVNRGALGWAIKWSTGGYSWMPDEATARLTEASQDMFEAALGALEWIEDVGEFEPGDSGQSDWLCAAIAKALGQKVEVVPEVKQPAEGECVITIVKEDKDVTEGT